MAGVIRVIILTCPVTGPSFNPVLGTAWAFYATSAMPRDATHYIVYWITPLVAGACATAAWKLLLAVSAPPAPKQKTL